MSRWDSEKPGDTFKLPEWPPQTASHLNFIPNVKYLSRTRKKVRGILLNTSKFNDNLPVSASDCDAFSLNRDNFNENISAAALANGEFSPDEDKLSCNCGNFNGNSLEAALDDGILSSGDGEFSDDRYNFGENECQLGGNFPVFPLG